MTKFYVYIQNRGEDNYREKIEIEGTAADLKRTLRKKIGAHQFATIQWRSEDGEYWEDAFAEKDEGGLILTCDY